MIFARLILTIAVLFGVLPAGLQTSSAIARGVYAGTNAGNCCWMGQSAHLELTPPPQADTLLLNIYIPPYAAPPRGQTLRVRINGAVPVTKCCLLAGEHELAIALPARHGSRALGVEITAARTFVPKALGLNADPRHLSVLLREVAFMNARTGERFDLARAPWLPGKTALLLLALGGVLVFLCTLRRPVYGAAALVLTDPFLFAYSTHGTEITLPKVALIAVLLGLLPQMNKLRGLPPHRAFWLVAGAQTLVILAMLPAAAHAVLHAPALRETLKACEFLLTLAVAYGAYRLDPDEEILRVSFALVTIGVVISAIAQAFIAPVQSETIAGIDVTRLAGALEGPNQLAGYLGIVVPVMLAFALSRPAIAIERIAIALGAATCVFTFSRGGVAALLLAIAVVLLLRYRPAMRAPLGISLAALFAGLLALAFGVFDGSLHGKIASIFGPTGLQHFNGGLGSRLDLWHGAYAMWRAHPIFGIGPGNFEIAIGRYDPGIKTHANSVYFQTLAEEGIAGFLALLLFTVASAAAFIRRAREPLVIAACAVVVAMSFHQIVDCMWFYVKVGVMFWVTLGIGAAAYAQQEDGASAAEDSGERVQRGAHAVPVRNVFMP